MEENKIKIAEHIKILRSENGLSQQSLADMLHVTRQTISGWEKGSNVPDIYTITRICNLFNLGTDDFIYGKRLTEAKLCQDYMHVEKEEDYISCIRNKGYYDIINTDIEDFFPIIAFPFARIMGIALTLKEKGYEILDIYGNGFSIFFDTDEKAQEFSGTLYDIIDEIVHRWPENSLVVQVSEELQERVDEFKYEVIQEIKYKLLGTNQEDLYYWIDEHENVRGYAKSEIECHAQAKRQDCILYQIFHG